MTRHAVVLMNLGGPDSPAAVRPFLYNLFKDPAIIGVPAPFRLPLAWLVAKRRSAVAADIYAHLGGASPLLANTEAPGVETGSFCKNPYRCEFFEYCHPPIDTEAVRSLPIPEDKIRMLLHNGVVQFEAPAGGGGRNPGRAPK